MMIVSCPTAVGRVRSTPSVSWSLRRRGLSISCTDTNDEALPSDGSVQHPDKNDLLKRIAKAKAYKKNVKSDQKELSLSKESAEPLAGSLYGEEIERLESTDRKLSNEEFQARFNRGSTDTGPSFRAGEEEAGDMEKWETRKLGSAEERASFLTGIEDMKTIEPGQRPEDFSLEEEERKKSVGAEVISVDKSYRPKVSTWGVFPRPANISETYGGGRTIDPSEFQKQDSKTKDQSFQETLLEYKKKRGLYVAPEIEKAFNEVFEQGELLLKEGRLSLASDKFEIAREMVDFKTRLGGNADLKKAICLDSMGHSKAAKAIYEQLTKHPQGDIQTQAKRMLFGFKAMDYLKVNQTERSPSSLEYERYFTMIPQDWNSTYVSTEEQKEDGVDVNLLISLLVVLLPIGFIVGLLILH